jgi:hypothetical protein
MGSRCSAAPNHVLSPEVNVRKTGTCFQLFDFEHLIIGDQLMGCCNQKRTRLKSRP